MHGVMKKSQLDFEKKKAECGCDPAAVIAESPPTETFHTVSEPPLLWRLMPGWMRVIEGRREERGGGRRSNGREEGGRHYAAQMSCDCITASSEAAASVGFSSKQEVISVQQSSCRPR